MAKKKSANPAPVKKSALVKKVATKKPVAKKPAVKKTPKKPETEKRTGPGRPPGPLYVPEWIEVMKSATMARANSIEPMPGIKSVTLKAGPEGAIQLENLVKLLESKDARLVKLIK